MTQQSATITYAKVVPCDRSISKINDLTSILNIDNAVAAKDLHATVVYSRSEVIGLDLIEIVRPLEATPVAFDLFDNGGKKCLVIKLKSDDLDMLHWMTREMGASYDYIDYHPHITVSYDYNREPPADEVLDTIGIIRFNEFRLEPFDEYYGT